MSVSEENNLSDWLDTILVIFCQITWLLSAFVLKF